MNERTRLPVRVNLAGSADLFAQGRTVRVEILKYAGVVLICVVVYVPPVAAQEAVGKRLFSDTLTIPEPFVEDELTFPSMLHLRGPGRRTSSIQVGFEVKKRIARDLEISVGTGVTRLNSSDGGKAIGFDNLDVG
jgi:hypothetical protein